MKEGGKEMGEKETLFFSRRKMFYVFKALEWPLKNNYLC